MSDFSQQGAQTQDRKGGDLAPEMFLNESYTVRVDVYALGLVIAGLFASGFPRPYRVDEGPSWCEAATAPFKQYEEPFQAVGVSELVQIPLTALVGGHMLKMKPEERESAPGCLESGGSHK